MGQTRVRPARRAARVFPAPPRGPPSAPVPSSLGPARGRPLSPPLTGGTVVAAAPRWHPARRGPRLVAVSVGWNKERESPRGLSWRNDDIVERAPPPVGACDPSTVFAAALCGRCPGGPPCGGVRVLPPCGAPLLSCDDGDLNNSGHVWWNNRREAPPDARGRDPWCASGRASEPRGSRFGARVAAQGGCTSSDGGPRAAARPPAGAGCQCDEWQLARPSRGACAGLGRSGPPSARLETRIKESMEPAGCLVRSTKPQGVVKATPARMVQQRRTRGRGPPPHNGAGPAGPPARCCTGRRSRSPVDRVLSACKVHGTRKVVNYTVPR